MIKDSERFSYSNMLDSAGKAAAALGVVLGLAYIFGFFLNYYYYKTLRSLWVIDLIDPQGVIRDGLPWLTMFSMIFFTLLFFADSLVSKKFARWAGLIVLILSGLLAWPVGLYFDIPENHNFTGEIFTAIIASVGCYVLALAVQLYKESASHSFVYCASIIGVACVFFIAPQMTGYYKASSVMRGLSPASVLVDDKGKAVGMLAGSMSGKFLILDCNVPYEIWISESSSLKVRPATGECVPNP